MTCLADQDPSAVLLSFSPFLSLSLAIFHFFFFSQSVALSTPLFLTLCLLPSAHFSPPPCFYASNLPLLSQSLLLPVPFFRLYIPIYIVTGLSFLSPCYTAYFSSRSNSFAIDACVRETSFNDDNLSRDRKPVFIGGKGSERDKRIKERGKRGKGEGGQ